MTAQPQQQEASGTDGRQEDVARPAPQEAADAKAETVEDASATTAQPQQQEASGTDGPQEDGARPTPPEAADARQAVARTKNGVRIYNVESSTGPETLFRYPR